MTTILQLKDRAERSAKAREHILSKWRKITRPSGCTIHRAACLRCGMEVDVDTAPKGIDVSGEAVALECTGWKAQPDPLCECGHPHSEHHDHIRYYDVSDAAHEIGRDFDTCDYSYKQGCECEGFINAAEVALVYETAEEENV